MNPKFIIVFSILLVSLPAGCLKRKEGGPLSPRQALESFRLHEDFRIELFAAEPDVADPVELAFDEDGRAYVAEMRDYPEDPPVGNPPRSRIRLLEDTDGDGRVDRSVIFADGLLQATSVMPWKGGLLVTAAPDILYLKDTNGDGKADLRRVLFSGFALVNPESRITNLRFAVDNWIYASNNGHHGNITFREQPEAAPVSVLGADFRFRLDRGEFEAESGPTQFGQAMDDWGHRFVTQNTVHVRHVVIPRRYLDRNPFLAVEQVTQDISDHGRPSAPVFQLTAPQYWRQERSRMRQKRYRENQLDRVRPPDPSTEIASGYFTGAAGGTIYAGDSFPGPFRGNLFTGDVATNLVHRDILQPSGVSFVASRAAEEREREFLASTDQWFRPCNFTTGPDGNLYLVDIYREFIETPESVPEELKKNMDFYSGDTLGRIYRIVPKNAAPLRPARPRLSQATGAELVDHLSHPNAWWRLTAQRLLLERQDPSVVPLLQELLLKGRSPQARLHALYALEGLSSLDSSLLQRALQDPHPGVREHAVQLAERFPELAGRLAAMIDDPSPRVAFQLALSLGEFAGEDALSALAELAAQRIEDRWFRTAVLSSPLGSSMELLERLSGRYRFWKALTAEKEEFLKRLATVIGARNRTREMERFLAFFSVPRESSGEEAQAAALSGLGRGLKLAGVYRLKSQAAEKYLPRWIGHRSQKIQSAARQLVGHFEMSKIVSAALQEAVDEKLPVERRIMAVQMLAGGSFQTVRPAFETLLSTAGAPDLVDAAIRSLSVFDDASTASLLIAHWKRFSPEIRSVALDVLLDHRARVLELLGALEEGRIERAALDPPRVDKLLRSPDQEISARARQIFQERPRERARVVEAYRSSLQQSGEAARGKVVFEKNCASCHLPGRGKRVGPSLAGVSSQTREQLLQAILDPSASIEPRYTNYIVITRDGRIHDGVIASETPGVLTLRRSEGEEESILRSHIVQIRASDVSLMPDGLESDLTRQHMADLIAFLQGAHLRD